MLLLLLFSSCEKSLDIKEFVRVQLARERENTTVTFSPSKSNGDITYVPSEELIQGIIPIKNPLDLKLTPVVEIDESYKGLFQTELTVTNITKTDIHFQFKLSSTCEPQGYNDGAEIPCTIRLIKPNSKTFAEKDFTISCNTPPSLKAASIAYNVCDPFTKTCNLLIYTGDSPDLRQNDYVSIRVYPANGNKDEAKTCEAIFENGVLKLGFDTSSLTIPKTFTENPNSNTELYVLPSSKKGALPKTNTQFLDITSSDSSMALDLDGMKSQTYIVSLIDNLNIETSIQVPIQWNEVSTALPVVTDINNPSGGNLEYFKATRKQANRFLFKYEKPTRALKTETNPQGNNQAKLKIDLTKDGRPLTPQELEHYYVQVLYYPYNFTNDDSGVYVDYARPTTPSQNITLTEIISPTATQSANHGYGSLLVYIHEKGSFVNRKFYEFNINYSDEIISNKYSSTFVIILDDVPEEDKEEDYSPITNSKQENASKIILRLNERIALNPNKDYTIELTGAFNPNEIDSNLKGALTINIPEVQPDLYSFEDAYSRFIGLNITEAYTFNNTTLKGLVRIGSSVTLENTCNIIGHISVEQNGNLTINGANISNYPPNGSETNLSAGIRIKDGASCVLKGSTISGYKHGIEIIEGTFTMESGSIENNGADTTRGAGIYMSNSNGNYMSLGYGSEGSNNGASPNKVRTCILKGGTIKGNTATMGAGIYLDGSNASLYVSGNATIGENGLPLGSYSNSATMGSGIFAVALAKVYLGFTPSEPTPLKATWSGGIYCNEAKDTSNSYYKTSGAITLHDATLYLNANNNAINGNSKAGIEILPEVASNNIFKWYDGTTSNGIALSPDNSSNFPQVEIVSGAFSGASTTVATVKINNTSNAALEGTQILSGDLSQSSNFKLEVEGGAMMIGQEHYIATDGTIQTRPTL